MPPGGVERLPLLEEAVAVLDPSPARLQHARALVELGAAQRRAGRREAARERLAEGLDGRVACGAMALAEDASPARPHHWSGRADPY